MEGRKEGMKERRGEERIERSKFGSNNNGLLYYLHKVEEMKEWKNEEEVEYEEQYWSLKR